MACVVDTVDTLVLLVGAVGWRVRPVVGVTGEIKAVRCSVWNVCIGKLLQKFCWSLSYEQTTRFV